MQSVMIRVIAKSYLFIASMITDRIGQNEVVLSVNHKISISVKRRREILHSKTDNNQHALD